MKTKEKYNSPTDIFSNEELENGIADKPEEEPELTEWEIAINELIEEYKMKKKLKRLLEEIKEEKE